MCGAAEVGALGLGTCPLAFLQWRCLWGWLREAGPVVEAPEKGRGGGSGTPSLPAPKLLARVCGCERGHGGRHRVSTANISESTSPLSRAAGPPWGEGVRRHLVQGSLQTSSPSWVRPVSSVSIPGRVPKPTQGQGESCIRRASGNCNTERDGQDTLWACPLPVTDDGTGV